MLQDVKKVIEEIRPAIQMDGGDLEFVEVDDNGIVKVRLQGACKHCPMASITLKNFVEAKIKKAVPEVTEVIAVE
ncbi:NifU family protein [Patescibacteria group bacterium]|nr:NifU family protein [Patescibacteria group bacterium]